MFRCLAVNHGACKIKHISAQTCKTCQTYDWNCYCTAPKGMQDSTYRAGSCFQQGIQAMRPADAKTNANCVKTEAKLDSTEK
jgi:hypothetical protein